MNKTQMDNKFSELLNHGIIYGLSSFLHSGLGFMLIPILTAYFTTKIFGVYSIILLIGVLSNSIFYLGATSSLSRFYFDKKNESHYAMIISNAFLISIFGVLLLNFLGLLFSDQISLILFENLEYVNLLKLNFFAVSLTIFFNLFLLILRFQRKSIIYLTLVLFNFLLNFTVTYLLLEFYNFGLFSPILGIIIPLLLILLYLIFHFRKYFSMNINLKYFKLMMKFGIQSSIMGILIFNLEWIDRLIIKEYLDLESVGLYTFAYKVAALINVIFVLPFSFIWSPMRMEYLKEKNYNMFFSNVISFYTIFGVLIIFISILFVENILSFIIINKEYFEGIKVFPIIMIGLFIYGYNNLLDFGIHLSKKLYFVIFIYIIGMIINFSLNIWLIPIYGYYAAAYVTLITYVFTSISIFIISNKYYRVVINLRNTVLPFLFLILFYFVNLNLNLNLFHKVLSLAVFVFIIYFVFINNNQRNYLINFIYYNILNYKIK